MDPFPGLTPLPPLPPMANEALPRRETAPDPRALVEERQNNLDELAAWYAAEENNPLFCWMVSDPFLRQRSGVEMGENPNDWSNMLLAEIRRPDETQEEKLKMMYRIANFVVKCGIEHSDCELKGMPRCIQFRWAEVFQKIRRSLRNKPTKPPL